MLRRSMLGVALTLAFGIHTVQGQRTAPPTGAPAPRASHGNAGLSAANAAQSPESPSGTRPSATRSPSPPVAPAKTNPLLPPAIPIDAFFVDLNLIQKSPANPPAGFEPLYTPQDWSTFRQKYGTQADTLASQKPSAQIAFADRLIQDAASPETGTTAGLKRLLLVRAVAIAYRNREGFPLANQAVNAFQTSMDKKSPAQIGALWSMANAISRLAVTPKPERIRYDGLAARANMQLSLLMLDAGQVDAAQAITRQVAYHEGWLKSDPETRGRIAQVRTQVKQTDTMMDYLAKQYDPALHNDVTALTCIYLYGRYVKNDLRLVEDLPGRIPGTTLAQLATSLDAAGTSNPSSAFAAAEQLRMIAASIPDAMLRQRTLYAALQLYDLYNAAPQTQRDRLPRTLARMSREAVIADGARRAAPIDPFANSSATSSDIAAVAGARTFLLPVEDSAELENTVLKEGRQPWRVNPEIVGQFAVSWAARQTDLSPALKARLQDLSEQAPTLSPAVNGTRQASWDDRTVVVSLTNLHPAEPDGGLWVARSVSVIR